MKISTRFLSENMLISICGHLLVVAIVVTSFALMPDIERLVAPDRIQIIEVDLDNVRVTGTQTVLYNVNADSLPDKTQTATPKKAEPVRTPDADSSEIASPSMLDDVSQPQADSTTDKKQPDDKPAPKKTTIVRVKREVVSLDRTLTVSVADALRVAMTRCWNIDPSRTDIGGIRAVAHLKMRRNGTVRDVWFESAARAETDSAFGYVLETIKSAINVCQPLRMLPEKEYDSWQDITLTFYPSTGAVM